MAHRKKVNLEQSLIENCVKRSREIIYLKASKLMLRNAQLLLNGVTKVFPSMEHLNNILQSIDVSIEDHQLSIARGLNAPLEQHGIKINIKEGFWFTYSEMKKGYTIIGSKVLFLGTTFDGPFKIIPGEIHSIQDVQHLLTNITPITGVDSQKLKYSISKLKKDEKYKKQAKERNDCN
jgi:hypothetical protein